MARYCLVRQGCVLTTVALLTAVLPVSGQEVEWRRDYRHAREEARATGRPLLIDFGTDHCIWCRKMEATTFRDPAVAAVLAREFIPLRIDAARQSALTHALKIERYPTLLFAASDGTILGRQVGYVDAGRFRGQMERALASVPGRPAPEQGAERAYQEAGAAIKVRDYPRAIALLRQIVRRPT